MPSPLLVAVDDGYAQTKLVGASPSGTGLVKAKFRSAVRSGRHAIASLSGDGAIGTYRTEEGEQFTVSDAGGGEKTQFDGFHTSPMNRVLVHHALLEAGYGGHEVKLCAGLPVGDFFRGTEKDESKIAAKTANLMRGIESTTPDAGAMTQLAEVRIGCQAVSAFVDYLLDDQLEERDVPIEKVAVVDVGGRTTDIALILGGAKFDPSRSGTENIGVLDVYRALNDLVRAKFDTRDDYALSMLDTAVRTGQIKLWGKFYDVSDLVTAAVREQETKIARVVEGRLGSASDIDTVLFVGGGSALFAGVAQAFRNGVVAEDPEFANARGLFKYVARFG